MSTRGGLVFGAPLIALTGILKCPQVEWMLMRCPLWGERMSAPVVRVLVMDSPRSVAALRGLCHVKRCLAQVTAFLWTAQLQRQTAVPAPSPPIKNMPEGSP